MRRASAPAFVHRGWQFTRGGGESAMITSTSASSNTIDTGDILQGGEFDEAAFARAFRIRRDHRKFLARSVMLCVAVFVYITYAVLDTTLSAPMHPDLLFLRYGIVMPLLIGVAITFSRGWFRGREHLAFLICMVLTIGSILYVNVLFDKPLARTIPPGATAVLFLIWLIYLPSFRHTVAMALSVLLSLTMFTAVTDMDMNLLFVNVYFIGLYCALLVTGMFFLDATERGHETFRHDLRKTFDLLRWSESRAVELYRDAKKAERAKDELLAVAGHELRTPMNAIIGFSEIMSKEMMGRIEPPKYHEYALHIHDSGHHLLGLINDILDVSHAERGRITLEARPFDIAATFEAALIACAEDAERSGVLLVRDDTSLRSLTISGDEARIAQAMSNILGNAIKFSHRGGRVVTSLASAEDGTVHFTVTDTGIGIAAEDITVVMQPFQQVQSAFTRNTGGLGLGLAICAIVARSHGGELRIESKLDEGTIVTLALPRHKVSESSELDSLTA